MSMEFEQIERERKESREPEFIAGMIDYSARTAIRDLVRLHGFEEARELVAMFINDEADRRPRDVRKY